MRLALFLAIFSMGLGFARADEDLDAPSQEALIKTQHLMKDKKSRDEEIKNSPKSKEAHDFLNKLTGGNEDVDDEVYSLAAEVFAAVVHNDHGDPKKMKESMDKFSSDPAGFASTWTPEQRKKLHELSKKLGKPVLKSKETD